FLQDRVIHSVREGLEQGACKPFYETLIHIELATPQLDRLVQFDFWRLCPVEIVDIPLPISAAFQHLVRIQAHLPEAPSTNIGSAASGSISASMRRNNRCNRLGYAIPE
ncbi:MAG: hypothetical protein GY946_21815, partial [bacterium]|nr:hypothetical protein [bacterium]